MDEPQVESTEMTNTSPILCKGRKMTQQVLSPRAIMAFDVPFPGISRRGMAADICLC